MRSNHTDAVLSHTFRLISLSSVGSTNEEAARYARMGEPAGLLVVAGEQLAGKGRFQRTWISPRGGLYCSLLLRPACPASSAPEIGFIAAVALAEAIGAVVGPQAVACKWPNDVLVHGRKVAGILLESATDKAGRLEWVVLGIGINIASHPSREAVQYPATCLAREGAPALDPNVLRDHLLPPLARWLGTWQTEGFTPVRSAWLRLAYGRGEEFTVTVGERQLRGRFLDVDASGGLILETMRGREVISAGECFPTRNVSD